MSTPPPDTPDAPSSSADDLDDEPLERCYRHPDVETALHCLECDRPICVDCAVHAAVGIKCPEHARLPRAARGRVPVRRLVAGAVVAGSTGLLAGIVLDVLRVPYLGLILAWLAGMGIGELTRRATGGFRDVAVTRIAATGAFVGLALPVLLDVLRWGIDGISPTGTLFQLLGAGLAAWAAATRAS